MEAHPAAPSWPRLVASRGGALTAGLLIALAALAWVATSGRMEGMDGGPGVMSMTLGFFALSWTLMMAAMMLPAITPVVLTYEAVRAGRERRGERAPAASSALLVGGYLLVWVSAGAAGWLVYEAGRAIAGEALAWDRGGRWLAAGTLAASAIYQLTSLKGACLVHCRNPVRFIAEHWRPGSRGALRIGVEHGAWCLGCCWALMAGLFALGVMDLRWMAVVAAAIAAEKLLPAGRVARYGVAVGLLALAVAVAADPGAVPWLMEPMA